MSLRLDISAQVTSIREKVYETLKEAILNGSYVQGEHLKERDIALSFGVSTTPVKEALRRLDQEGLVITKPRIGTYVSTNIMNSIEEITWARSAMEGVVARLAAIKITDQECSQLQEHIKKIEKATEELDSAQLFVLNEAFHKMIHDISRNDYIAQQISAIKAFDRVFRKQALSNTEEFQRAFREHNLICEMIVNRDPDGAEEAMRSHIRRTASYVSQQVKN
ncbi:GntR family transcriptional regulator [Paenibacillus aceris]|uniref:DNA-binding GntR family transcriptional regulator n=1 Tax=Paenibacillus aceris TaxID=869555 RepID=A0ABS4I041_9BACL|nr:GntR family transcriptional regulator [Paenibacillus aceris]MBP1964255.1 DNA-binding GntR family transcriptional regulator [Paenibacillus aceris]NHW36578.1 GntR family transcriptional regulator [Paenibacillus aceris]